MKINGFARTRNEKWKFKSLSGAIKAGNSRGSDKRRSRSTNERAPPLEARRRRERKVHFHAARDARTNLRHARTKEIAIMHLSRTSLLRTCLGMINSPAIVPYLESRVFPRTAQRVPNEGVGRSFARDD